MLCGKNFRRSHQRGLTAVFNHNEHGLQRDDGLTGADISLEQPAHGRRLAQVRDDFAESALLRRGGVKGQNLSNGFADSVIGLEGEARAFLHAASLEFESAFQVEEFFKNEALVRRRG